MKAAPAHNPEIAQSLDDIADLLELEEANPFRVRAYQRAAAVEEEIDLGKTGRQAHAASTLSRPARIASARSRTSAG